MARTKKLTSPLPSKVLKKITDPPAEKASFMEKPPTTTVRLRLWPGEGVDVPTGLLRFALFGATMQASPDHMERKKLIDLDGIKIIYNGFRLGQGDIDVWEIILHLTRHQNNGVECRFTVVSMLQVLDWADTPANQAKIYDCITRLKSNNIEISYGRYGTGGSLIDRYKIIEATQEFVLTLNQKFVPLFNDQFSRVFS